MAPKKSAAAASASASTAVPTEVEIAPEVVAEAVPEAVTEGPASAPTASSTAASDVIPARIQATMDRVVAVQALLSGIPNILKELTSDLKALQKEWTKQQKQNLKDRERESKRSRRRRRANTEVNADGTPNPEGTPKPKPGGFDKPTLLSDQMCQFLGLPEGSMLSRTNVTRQLNKYIKDNNLCNPEDKRILVPDAKLQELLKGEEGKDLTYFTLQTFIKHHFIAAPAAPAVTAADAAAAEASS